MRLSKHEMYMQLAATVARRSHDAQTQVGAVLINNSNGSVISMGYNGFLRGANDKKLPNTRPDKYQYMIHAEENLIANSAKNGISMDNCTVYCTMSPCARCMRLLFQSGITRVVFRNKYKDFDSLLEQQDINLTLTKTPEKYTVIEYTARNKYSFWSRLFRRIFK